MRGTDPHPTENISVDFGAEYIHVGLNRPPVNAFTPEMFEGVVALFTKIAEDPRPVFLSGGSGVFSAGFDMKTPISDRAVADIAARACIASVREHPGPTVAAVESAAVGMGLLLAMSVDLLVVARDTRLKMPEITLGIDADVDPLRRFIPEPWVRRMCLLGETFSAEDLCLQASGVTICEPGGAYERGVELVRALGGLNPRSLRDMKRRLANV
jgi:enoyl-CoA hydratase